MKPSSTPNKEYFQTRSNDALELVIVVDGQIIYDLITILTRNFGSFLATSKQILDSLLTGYNVVDYRLVLGPFILFSFLTVRSGRGCDPL